VLDDIRLASIGRDRDAHRGKIGEFDESIEKDVLLNEDEFTRVFEISAIRVPAKDCFALENRLRGHLLNWPRIRNIARVPGDEIEEDVVKLLGRETDEEEEERSEKLVLTRNTLFLRWNRRRRISLSSPTNNNIFFI